MSEAIARVIDLHPAWSMFCLVVISVGISTCIANAPAAFAKALRSAKDKP